VAGHVLLALFVISSEAVGAIRFGVNVNFQAEDPGNEGLPPGYQVDLGKPFANRGNGLFYGWDRAAPVRNRHRGGHARLPDERFDTLAHFRANAGEPGRTWTLMVPNGQYLVRGVFGDPQYGGATQNVQIEDRQFTDPDPGAPIGDCDEYFAPVSVHDGKLTIGLGPGADFAPMLFVQVREIAKPEIAVNFQKAPSPDRGLPAHYKIDAGAAFGDRPDGPRFGWIDATNGRPADNRRAVDLSREQGPDGRHRTLNFLNSAGKRRDWEIAVENGRYQILALFGGSPSQSTSAVEIEGTRFVDADPGMARDWDLFLGTVPVEDGRLTVRALPGEQPASICYLEITRTVDLSEIQVGDDFKHQLPRIPPREPDEALDSFRIVDGFRIELAAAEPLVLDPVDLTFDENGRLYVCELPSFPPENFKKLLGRVRMLEDTDHDGRFDKSGVLIDDLSWPTGIQCFDGGVFVASAPDLLYCKDTDGDGKADIREVVLTGFSTENLNACVNSLRWGLDNRVHGMTSYPGGQLRAVRWEQQAGIEDAKPVQGRGRDFSFHPRSGQLRLESGGAQFGMNFDAWGRKFEVSNSAPLQTILYEDRYVARNPYLAAPSARVNSWASGNAVYMTARIEPWRILRTALRAAGKYRGPVEGGGTPSGYFTGVSGILIYTGDLWPDAYRNSVLVGETSSHLMHRMRLEPNGVGFRGYRTEQNHEFLTSDDTWIRPVQMTEGADGAVYIADMYRETIEDPIGVPKSITRHLDYGAGRDRGRIYRIVPQSVSSNPYDGPPRPSKQEDPAESTGSEAHRTAESQVSRNLKTRSQKLQRRGPTRLGDFSTAELVRLLEHPNGWHRRTAGRLLYERQDRGAVELLERMAAESASPLGRMHAICTLDGMDALTEETVAARLDDPHPRVREHAVRLAERLLAESPLLRTKLCAMNGDPDMRVRYQLAFTLGEVPGAQATRALAAIARRDAGDPWIRLAVLSSCVGRAGELFSELAADADNHDSKAARTMLTALARQAGLQPHADQVAEVLNWIGTSPDAEKTLIRSVVRGLVDGLEKSNNPLRQKVVGGARVNQVLDEMVRHAKTVVADQDRPAAQRAEAIPSLAFASFDAAGETLSGLLDSRQPQAVQMAALKTLGRFRQAEVAEWIVERWPTFSPQVRGEAAEVLFARSERVAALIDAIEEGVVLPSQLAPARLNLLKNHRDRTVRDRATRLLGDAKLARREEAVADYREVLSWKGDVQRGRQVFRRECATCHRLEGVGYDLGLPLASVRNRGPEFILTAILDPNREVLPQYLGYVVVTEDGLSISGMIASETATSLILRRAEGKSDTVLRTQIDELHNTGLSIMPEGLEKQIPKQDMADLIHYLMSLL